MTRQCLTLYLMERLWRRSSWLRVPVDNVGLCTQYPQMVAALKAMRPHCTVVDLMKTQKRVQGVYAAAFSVESFSWKPWMDAIDQCLEVDGYLQGMTLAPGSLIELGQDAIWPPLDHWVKLLQHEGWGEMVLDQQTLTLEYQSEQRFREDSAVLYPAYEEAPQRKLTLELLFFYARRIRKANTIGLETLRDAVGKATQ